MNSHMHKWILDFGASFHVTSHKHWFENLHESDHGHVITCDNIVYKVVGVGDITVKFENGFVHILNGVRYIPQMGRNLIFVGEL